MVLLDSGYGLQAVNWHVTEKKAVGYSRVYYIVTGDVCYKEDQIVRQLHTNCLYVFPANQAYSINHTPDNCIECLWFHIDFLPTVVDEIIEIAVEKESSLQYLLQALTAHIRGTGTKDDYFHSLIHALTCFLHQNYLHRYPKRLEEVIFYIHRNFKNNLTVAQLSQHFGYCNEYFIRLFQKSIGTTPYQYIINCKLNEAAKLLQQGIPVIQVAHLTGFRDEKTFSRVFKQKYFIAPSKFKKYYYPSA